MPLINIYELDIERIKEEYRYLKFDKYDQRWLDSIVRSRKGDFHNTSPTINSAY